MSFVEGRDMVWSFVVGEISFSHRYGFSFIRGERYHFLVDMVFLFVERRYGFVVG